ncbi:NAD(P)/FAD-dependent oxidoreductase [Ferroacidibacillus organovorans]|uniref:Pyridine nucleotide-disulfide oxidoreductase n=1 Tax=Ferroacidibacillus organovorans TaxID=1765683 RepID=A0A101XQN1_9BACL|nr:NAD(P)/FAD-dependent oxidoreductase [Ferroacidibacillus organovorans]KUO95742.1 pyridine nucleotide-disulfide oxidoreductase [Ferroacidibacillus organovorans]
MEHIVILGGGYAGLLCAQELRKHVSSSDAEITLVNKHAYHQLITQLHETAVGARPDRSLRLSLSKLLEGKNVEIVKGTVSAILPDERLVELQDGRTITYDKLVVALGSETEYFGIAGMKEHAFTLKSVNQARLIRAHIESCFARYLYERDPALLRFVVGGAGFSGIELVGELADALPQFALEAGISMDQVELYNIEAAPGILPGFDKDLVDAAQTSLTSRGVRFMTGAAITQVEPGRVTVKTGEVIETHTVIWTGGVRGNQLVVDAGFETEPRGRAKVNEYLQSVSHPDVYIIGDACFVIGEEGRPLPPTAQLAWQMGIASGKNITNELRGAALEPFKPNILGALASLGRKDAVGKVFKSYKMYGKMAYMAKEASQMRYLAKIGAMFHSS